jgi:outer membrane protein assembly factor BamB
MKKLLTVIILLVGLFLSSCSDDKPPEPFNTRGGAGRVNNYEEMGTFLTNLYNVEKIEMDDSSAAIVPPLILDGIDFYIATVNGSVALIEERKAKWMVSLPDSQYVVADMCADIDKNLYLVTNRGEIISYDKSGKLRWKYLHQTIKDSSFLFDALLAQKDGIVVSASPGLLFKLSLDGKKMWQLNHKFSTVRTFCATESGNIAFPSTQNDFEKSDTLYFITPDGKIKWKKAYDKTRILKNPVSYKNLIIYPASYMLDGTRLYLLIALDTNGNEVWRQELNIMPEFISCGHNRVYLLSYNSGYGETMSGIFCYDLDGNLKWKIYTGNKVPAPLLISETNIAFFGTKGNTAGVFFLNRDGTLYHSVSLSDAPLFSHKPFVLNVPAVAFMGSEKLFIIKIDDTAIDRILPW